MKSVERDDHGRLQPGTAAVNQRGKGGFQDRPQDINRKGRPKNQGSIVGSLRKFMQLKPAQISELVERMEAGELTEAESQALRTLLAGRAKGKRGDDARREIMDRIDGKPRMTVDTTVRIPDPPTINITFG